MEGKIREGIKNIEMRIGWEQKHLGKAVEDFKEAAAAYDAYHIETFIPGKIKDIAGHRAEIEKLEEQKQILEYMLKQGC